MVDIQFGTVLLVRGFGSVQNSARGSVGDSTLAPISADTLCSNARAGSIERSYVVGDVENAFGIFEGVSSRKGPSDQAFCVNSVTGYVSSCLVNVNFLLEFWEPGIRVQVSLLDVG